MSRTTLQLSWIGRKAAAIFVIVIVALSAAVFTGKASAAPGGYTIVFNHGNNPGDTCTNDLYFSDGVNLTLIGHYEGFMALVINKNHFIQHCTMFLVYGAGVSSQFGLNFDGLNQVYTPGGVATIDINA